MKAHSEVLEYCNCGRKGNLRNLFLRLNNKKLTKTQFKMIDINTLSIFTHHLLNGKIRDAVRFITERQESGGVMMPHKGPH